MNPATGVRRFPLSPSDLVEPVTNADDVFVLAHLGIPQIDPEPWALVLDGLVERPLRLTLADLKARPKVVVEAAHQCCGSPLEPTVPTRRIANVRWAGADLAALLMEAGVQTEAKFLWSHGLDSGEFAGVACNGYVKDLPLTRLRDPGVLVAYEMNDAPLSAEHGFPARLVVPGFYGTNSVKWLWRLKLAGARVDGLFTTKFYNDPATRAERAAGSPPERPVWAIAPECVLVAPADGATAPTGRSMEIWGWAWARDGIGRIETSVDGGRSWAPAELQPARGWAWRRFSVIWTPSVAGDVVICARAFDTTGAGQPMDGARNAVHQVRALIG